MSFHKAGRHVKTVCQWKDEKASRHCSEQVCQVRDLYVSKTDKNQEPTSTMNTTLNSNLMVLQHLKRLLFIDIKPELMLSWPT